MDESEAAEAIWRAVRINRTVTPPSRSIPALDLDRAYRVQDAFIERMSGQGLTVAGAKIGLSDPRSRAALGVESPLSGLLFESMKLSTGALIERSAVLHPRVEAEICFALGRTLDDPDLSEDAAAAAIAQVMPAIEVIDSRFPDWSGTVADTVAENIAAAWFVCGPPVHIAAPERLADCTMEMTIDGNTAATANGRAPCDGPVKALHWLARHLARRGRPLQAGAYVMSGAFAPMVAVAPGQNVAVRIAGAGHVEVTFGA